MLVRVCPYYGRCALWERVFGLWKKRPSGEGSALLEVIPDEYQLTTPTSTASADRNRAERTYQAAM